MAAGTRTASTSSWIKGSKGKKGTPGRAAPPPSVNDQPRLLLTKTPAQHQVCPARREGVRRMPARETAMRILLLLLSQFADVVTTKAALAAGATEGNPLMA